MIDTALHFIAFSSEFPVKIRPLSQKRSPLEHEFAAQCHLAED
jgi:hypothetical protein